MPSEFIVIEAAKELGISYYEMLEKPMYDLNMATAKMTSESRARKEINRIQSLKARNTPKRR